MEELFESIINGIRMLLVVAAISVPFAIWKIVELVGSFTGAW